MSQPIRIESLSSWWLLDEDAKTYTRLPKIERPRPTTHLSLEDGIPHPYNDWYIGPHPFVPGAAALILRLDSEPNTLNRIIAPLDEGETP